MSIHNLAEKLIKDGEAVGDIHESFDDGDGEDGLNQAVMVKADIKTNDAIKLILNLAMLGFSIDADKEVIPDKRWTIKAVRELD